LKEKTSHNKFRIGIKTNHLKVTRNLRENSSTGEANIFTQRCAPTTAIQVSTKYNVFIVFYDLKIKIKNNKYLRIFITNHKNAINIIYPDIQLGRCGEQRFVKIFAPPPVK
jgi:hypothetical protein